MTNKSLIGIKLFSFALILLYGCALLFGLVFFITNFKSVSLGLKIASPFTQFDFVLDALLGIGSFFALIGVFRLKERARKILVVLKVISILDIFLEVVLSFVKIQGAGRDIFLLADFVLAILILIFFTRPKISSQFSP